MHTLHNAGEQFRLATPVYRLSRVVRQIIRRAFQHLGQRAPYNAPPDKEMVTCTAHRLAMIRNAALRGSAEGGEIMGMPAVPEQVTTIEELMELPEDGMRHELLDGEHVVTPTPSVPHQRILRVLMRELERVLADRDDVELFSSPADIVLTPRTLVQPDLFVVANPAKGIRKWSEVGCPYLAIEILSPTTAARDRNKKRRLYMENGVEEYWIVDVDARVVERWRAGDERPQVVDGQLGWSLACGAAGEIALPALFERINR